MTTPPSTPPPKPPAGSSPPPPPARRDRNAGIPPALLKSLQTSKPAPATPTPANPADPSAAPGVGGAGAPTGPGSGPAGSRFVPRPPQPTLHPRKVRGGVKLASKAGPVSVAWAGQRWMRLVDEQAPTDNVQEGLEYARLGQTRQLQINVAGGSSGGPVGLVSARVQGRMPNAYSVEIRVPTVAFEHWEKVTATLAQEARHMASLLSGEVPASIEDAFAPAGLRLFPHDSSDLAVRCSCGYSARPDGGPWCKHACCVMALLAERLGQDPFLIFGLRGLTKEDLLDRLRQRRALAGASRGGPATGPGGTGAPASIDRPLPAYSPRLPGVTDAELPPIEQLLESYWDAPAELRTIDLALRAPEVAHPLLRRLGASPFPAGRFPLVGLLATCYDVVGAWALRGPTQPTPPADGSEPGPS